MRISDWSSDVCSSDLRALIDPRDRSVVQMRFIKTGRAVKSNATLMSTQTEISKALIELIRHEIQDAKNLDVSDVVRKSTGFSRENWTFLATWQDESGFHKLPLILRRDHAGSLLEPDRQCEYGVMNRSAEKRVGKECI